MSGLEEMVAEVLPIVEEVAGRRFERPPIVRSGSTGRLRGHLVDENAAQLQRILPQLSRSSARTQAFWEAELMLPALFGKYALADETLYLRPRAIPLALRATGQSRDLAPGIAKLILAHELAHALQDQEVDLEAMAAAAATVDAFHALGAVTEGHAVAVQRAVAQRLGLEEEDAAMRRLQGTSGVVGLYYVDGYAFVAAVAPDPAQAWAAVGDPPRVTRAIYRPADWHAEPVVAPPAPWSAVSEALGVAWPGLDRDFGAFEVREETAGASADARDQILAAFQSGRAVSASATNEVATLAVYTFADVESAARMLAVARGSFEAARQTLVGSTVAPVEMTIDEVPGLALPHVRMHTRIAPTQGVPAEGTAVWAQSGERVFKLEIANRRIDDTVLLRAIEAATR